MNYMDRLVDLLREEEGWRADPYDDATGEPVRAPVGTLTVGYGTAFPLTEQEGEWLLRHRLERESRHLVLAFQAHGVLRGCALPELAWLALEDMGYQLGVMGVLLFHKMLECVSRRDWAGAARECRDSEWHRQTPVRAERVAARFDTLAEAEGGKP